jgi:hypothetical protein
MADTKRGREEQARHEERRQREREIEQARERSDESEPPTDRSTGRDEAETEDADAPSGGRTCHRRGCDRPAAFVVTERYLEDTGHGAVEATAELCRDHTAEESPTRLDDAYPDYVFRVEPLSGSNDESGSNDGS